MGDYLEDMAYEALHDSRMAALDRIENQALAAHERGDEDEAQRLLAAGRRLRNKPLSLHDEFVNEIPEEDE